MPEQPANVEEHPIIKAYRSWAAVCPFVSRSIMIGAVCSWLLSFLFRNLEMAFSNQPVMTVNHFEVYRLVTSVFCGSTILTIIFGLMTFNSIGPRLESSLGSTGLLALTVTLVVVTNLLFIATCFLLTTLGKAEAWYMYAGGLWNMLMPLIAIECMASPEAPRKFFIFPVDIKSKYYPMVLTGIFFVMRSGPALDLLCAVGVGYLYAAGKLDVFKVSRSRLTSWESGCLSNFVQRQGYILNGSAVGADAWIPVNNPSDHPSNQRQGGGGMFGSIFGGQGGGEGGQAEGGGDVGDGQTGSGFGSNNVIKRGGNTSVGGSSTSDVFAGSGQTLGGSDSSGRARLLGRSHTAQHDIETARAARLAALGRTRGRTTAQGDQQETEGLLSSNDHDVVVLQDMGYSAEQAREALQASGGDMEAAVAYLSA